MTDREKLVELIASKVCCLYSPTCDEYQPHDCGKCYANDCRIADIADHLIANGVTVRRRGHWIVHPSGKTDEQPKYAECSVCHITGSPNWKSCPVCDSMMEG